MNETTRIEIPVEVETARALTDAHCRETVRRLMDKTVRPGPNGDRLAALPAVSAQQARSRD